MIPEKVLYGTSYLTSGFINLLRPVPDDANSILVIKLDEIGDMIHTLHCIEALAERFGDAQITVYCKPMNNALVKQTGVVATIINDPDKLKKHYDLQIDFRGDWKTQWFALKGGASYYLDRGTIRFRNMINGGQTHETVTNQNIIAPLFAPNYPWKQPELHISENDLQHVSGLLREHDVHGDFVLMHCGARDAARRWSISKFAELTSRIREAYGLSSVFIGSEGERPLVDEVIKQAPHAINLAGATDLMQLGALCRKCSLFVGNESGPLHFAIVEKKPLVALFGPGVKDVFYPLYPKQRVIHYFKKHGHKKQNESDSTIHQITVDEVMKAVREII